jgi:hypothetical protein
MPRNYCTGGQKRTTQFDCGFIICGHPTELKRRVKLHLKTCEHCKNGQKIIIPEFSTFNGRKNGWNGLSMKGEVIQTKDQLCFASIGEDILLDGVKLEKVYEIRAAEQQKKSESDVKR